ncbi:MAG: hypothetical protein JWM47_4427 [Acidimicrobiales bacterium]|nr:hypothetical protein [Acidimicrobiales bacterium]
MIERSPATRADVYEGTAEELIEAGIIRRDQLPPEGKESISYRGGRVMGTNCRKDETYLRIQRFRRTFRVWVGVSKAVGAERHAAERERMRVEREAFLLRCRQAEQCAADQEEVEHAKRALEQIPRSADAFRREVIEMFCSIAGVAVDHGTWAHARGGYHFEDEAVRLIKISFDAVVDAMVEAEVRFDQVKHEAAIQRYQTKIVDAHPEVRPSTTKLMQLWASAAVEEVL